jgi:tetrapyrrole methylase family protein / MazG family protein
LRGKITVIGLGPGDEESLPLGSFRLLMESANIRLRTEKHPVVEWLRQKGITFSSFDAVYEEKTDFPSVYDAIVERLLQEGREGKDILYAVPGHPVVAERTVQLLLQKGKEENVAVDIRGGGSFLDAAFARLQVDPVEGFSLLDATDLDPDRIDPRLHVMITQVYDRMVASDLKLSLMEVFPDDTPVTVASALGVADRERIRVLPLYELDREDLFNNLTMVYIPPSTDERVFNRRFDTLKGIIARLRAPDGCPWDRKQTHESLRPYLLEESYEFLEAVAEEDFDAMADELGDVLLQVLLHAQIASEEGTFDIRDVIANLSEKMIRRHPHVFGEAQAETAEEVKQNWDAIKAQEKKIAVSTSVLDGVPSEFPAMLRAVKLQKKAAKVGFDWNDPEGVRQKLLEELDELLKASEEQREEELGDLLFSGVALARHFQVDPEQALLAACRKFVRRFHQVEAKAQAAGRSLQDCSLEELDRWWDEVKEEEQGEG